MGVTDPDGDEVEITITNVTSDEPTHGLDEEDLCPDAVILGDGTVDVRAERWGEGNGRVYTIHFTATDESGDSCDGMVYVCVPHDRRPHDGDCIRDEAQYDATHCGRSSKASQSQPSTRPVVTRVTEDRVTILFTTETAGPVDLSIFDLRGRLVRRLAARDFPAGVHTLYWDGRNTNGHEAASGVYLVRVVMSGKPFTSKTVWLR
jgi:hypothetical protein